jgi:transposase InsO family protein
VIADVLSRLPFASGQESDAGTSKPIQTSTISSSANFRPDSVSLLVPDLDDSSSTADLDSESDADLDSDDEEEVEVEQCNSLSTSAPIIDLPISREGLEPEDFTIPTREEFAREQDADTELKQLRGWLEEKQCPSADELAGLSGRMKSFAQLFDEISIRDGLIIIKRHDDPERELTVVPSAKVEHLIRFYHEGPGAAHQAAKATSAKVIRCFWWPDLKRDVRLYIACCPVCERFLKVRQTPRAGLRSMDVGGRGDCLAMDIVGGRDSFPLTPRGHCYILTMIDCFTRYAVAVPLVNQSAEVIIAAIIGNYITVYGTPRRILTDQGRNFESDEFAKFCNLFRIFKIRTTAYRPQSNGICERFNQTLKNYLVKILSEAQQDSWDLYLNFAVFSYNLSVHSSTGFTPFFLTFGAEARLAPDIVFGTPSSNASAANLGSTRTSNGSVSFLFKSFSLLSNVFTLVRENLKTFHQREKDRYDLGAVERVFRIGDRVRVRIKSRQKGHSKFLSEWSKPHKVIDVRGVVVTLRELSTGREYRTHHDRFSNPLFFKTKPRRN